MTNSAERISHARSLQRLSTHLDVLADQVCSLEEILCEAFSERKSQPRIDLTKLQSLDFVRQSLEDCAILTLLMSNHTDANPITTQQLSRRLKLESTRSIIIKGSEETGQTFGEVQLF